MGLFDGVLNSIADRVASRIIGDAGKPIALARDYRQGAQKRQLLVKPNQFDDNIVLNFAGLIANRVVSQTIGQGVELDFEGDDKTETEQEKWVKACLDANKQEILFHRAVLSATEAGTGYFDLSGGSVFANGIEYPRITLLDPAFVTMESLPEDFEVVIKYTVQYKFTDFDGKERARKREVIKNVDGAGWEIVDSIASDAWGARWEVVDRTPWKFDFAPIIHWQNLPTIDSTYGEPDINADLIRLQDRVNFVASNLSKIIRLYAHPMRYAVGFQTADKLDVGPDQLIKLTGADSDIRQLEQLGDLAGSMEYLRMLRQAMFDRARVVDIDSMQDKLGALTNFGLKVLYQDNLNLIATKRELFGDAIEELVIRLQVIGNIADPLPADCVWPDFLPENDAEISAAYQSDLNMGVVSKETISGLRGYDWEQEQERISNDAAQTDNVGAAILRNFENGGFGG